jgi:hypothetical protein
MNDYAVSYDNRLGDKDASELEEALAKMVSSVC